MLSKRTINAPDASQAVGGYAQAVEIAGFSRILHVSGQIPVAQDGAVPPGFAEQCRLAWANVEAQLRAAGMTLDNLIKITTYLSDRRYGAENRDAAMLRPQSCGSPDVTPAGDPGIGVDPDQQRPAVHLPLRVAVALGESMLQDGEDDGIDLYAISPPGRRA